MTKLMKHRTYRSTNNPNFTYRVVSTGPKQTKIRPLLDGRQAGGVMMARTAFARADFTLVD